MPIDVPAFLASESAACMSNEQLGAYFRLLMHAWQGRPPCTIPDDDRALARLAGMTLRRWRTAGDLVRAKFVETDGKRLINNKLAKQYDVAARRHQVAVARARAGGRARARRAATSSAQAQPELSSSQLKEIERESTVPTRTSVIPASGDVADDGGRVRRFLDRYKTRYEELRGARYLGRPALDYGEARQLCDAFGDEDLDLMLDVFLLAESQNDPIYAPNRTRTVAMFRSKASGLHEAIVRDRARSGGRS